MEKHIPIYPFDGACTKDDPEKFFPERSNDLKRIDEAKAICKTCDVVSECLADALSERNVGISGIWGGTTEDERLQIRRRRLGRITGSSYLDQGIA